METTTINTQSINDNSLSKEEELDRVRQNCDELTDKIKQEEIELDLRINKFADEIIEKRCTSRFANREAMKTHLVNTIKDFAMRAWVRHAAFRDFTSETLDDALYENGIAEAVVGYPSVCSDMKDDWEIAHQDVKHFIAELSGININ